MKERESLTEVFWAPNKNKTDVACLEYHGSATMPSP